MIRRRRSAMAGQVVEFGFLNWDCLAPSLIFKLTSQISNHLGIGNHQSSLNFACSGAPVG